MTDFHISKQRVEAEVELAGGMQLSGAFLCSPRSEHHAGRETVADLLNESARFVPFFPHGSEQSMLLNKDHVHVVRLPAPDLPGDPEQLADFTEPHGVVLRMIGGSALEGTTPVAAPVGHTRTLDQLNQAGRFMHLDAGDHHLIVNLDAVASAEDA